MAVVTQDAPGHPFAGQRDQSQPGPAGPDLLGVELVTGRLEDVRRRIDAAGGDPERVRIVAVTKGFGPGAVEAARAAGLADVGENYAQEILTKAPLAAPGTRWHFLGPVQRNKVRKLVPIVSTWHGIDRPAAAEAVASALTSTKGPASDPTGVEVMVQVNVTGADGRPGCAPADVAEVVDRVRALPLRLTGLMAVGPTHVGDDSRECFRWLAGKAAELGLEELSMGMSDDFEMAVAEGATTLRLGRVLFGPRPEPKVRRG